MVDQIGTGNPADELIGDDRPPSRRSSALLVLVVLVLGGLAVSRLLDPHGAPQAAPADATPTAIEQLRPDGSRLVLEQFPFESRHPQGLAVDPGGTRVVYALTSKQPEGPYGLVVRDLRTGEVLVSRRTVRPYGVRAWTPAGVVLAVAMDPGGPPYVWTPGAGAPTGLPWGDRLEGGPFLLAASPVTGELAATDDSCVVLAAAGEVGRRLCDTDLFGPAAWSPDGTRIVGRSGRHLTVLDVLSGRTTKVPIPRAFVREVAWEDPRTVLLAVTDPSGEEGAVLRCRPGGQCRLAPLGALTRSPSLTLAR